MLGYLQYDAINRPILQAGVYALTLQSPQIRLFKFGASDSGVGMDVLRRFRDAKVQLALYSTPYIRKYVPHK